MVRKTKWIPDATADEPYEELARRALAVRLGRVWHFLSRANDEPDDEENVHQLRVSTRRAVAAMQIFEALLPQRRAAWMNKRLKRLRQAAGDARDLDVLADRLAEEQAAAGDERHALVLEQISAAREAARGPIEKIARKLARKNFAQRTSELIDRVHLRGESKQPTKPTLGVVARRELRVLVDQFWEAAASDLSDYQALHALRIQGKQLRYAMEIFSGAFDPSFRQELYPLVTELQDTLGKINDHATARALFANWLESSSDRAEGKDLGTLVEVEQAALVAGQQQFFTWWNAERRADLHRRFELALGADAPGTVKLGSDELDDGKPGNGECELSA